MQQSTTSLFLSQVYQDAWEEYTRSVTGGDFAGWDYIILTASNELQAQGFRAQIEARKNYLPAHTHFAVIPDEGGVRVGSGGATLSVLRYIRSREEYFDGLRILVIHSGGDSKRVPQYSALGKLFSPVPRVLPDGRRSTLFDELLIAMAPVPGRIRNGMLLLSGDVLLLFNPLRIDYSGRGAAAISFQEHVNTGKDHGVFLPGADGNVARFLHKQPVETLRAQGAVNEKNCVNIDTGAVIFSPAMLESLYSLIPDEESYHRLVNTQVRLSLYGDFLYPLAADSTLEDFYLEKPEGAFCDQLRQARTQVWNALRPYRMKLLQLSPARFIHFGTTEQVLELMNSGIRDYEALGWSRQVASSAVGHTACCNSVLSHKAQLGQGSYLESAYIHSRAAVGENSIVSYLEIMDDRIPSHVVLHGLQQRDGMFVARIYGVQDDPKKNLLFGKPVSLEGVWDGGDRTLWTAKLYPVCPTMEQAVKAALNLYALCHGGGDLQAWKCAQRKSLCAGFNDADPQAIIRWDERMAELVRVDAISKRIRAGAPVSQVAGTLPSGALTEVQQQWLADRVSQSDFSRTMRLYYYLGKALGGKEGDRYISKCFACIREEVLEKSRKAIAYNDRCAMVCDKLVVKSPLRINWGGGWSDTPPYCMERGGTVLNAAILLQGEMPVEVTLERLEEHKIVFDSRDMDVHGEFTDIGKLQQTGNPYDPFALQKAALIVAGIIPAKGGDLQQILERLGGGFRMNSEVTNVPKGSGLGTSSILSATCVKALYEFMGVSYTQDMLYESVLCMEQIMATGGGWQDQAGGITCGVKYITSKPGSSQKLKVQRLNLAECTQKELNHRIALIYTGQRRLARNLLRDVVGRYVGGEPETLHALDEIQRVAALMRFELERDNVDAFARLLDRHWELSRKIDAASSNTVIDNIFQAVSDLIDGRMACGAGGGGFLQVIMKKGVTRQMLRQRLKEVFPDTAVDVWTCQVLF